MYDGSLKFDTKLDSSGFETGIEHLGTIASGSMGLIRNLFSLGTDAVLSFGKSALAVGSDFSSALSQIGATLNFSVSEINDSSSEAFRTMELLTEKAEELGRTTKFTATEAAEGLNTLAMQGFTASESMDLIADSLNLASAGNIGISAAAGYIGTAVNGFVKETAAIGDLAEASQKYADMIAKGATLSATDVNALGLAFSSSAATAESYGQSSEELAVSLLRLAKQSVVGAEAATNLKTVMGRLYAPTQQVQELFDEIGFSAFENGQEKKFNQAADELNAALQNAFRLNDGSVDKEAYDKALNDIFGMRGLPAFTKMMASAGQITQDFYEGLANAEGSAAKQAEMQLDNLQGRIKLFYSALDGLKNKLSKTMEMPFRSLVDTGTEYITRLTEAFQNGGFSALGDTLGDTIGEGLTVISGYVPQASEIGAAFLTALFKSLSHNVKTYIKAGKIVVKSLFQAVQNASPDMASASFQILSAFADGMTQHLPELTKAVLQITDFIIRLLQNPDGQKLGKAGLTLVLSFAEAILKSAPVLLGYVPELIAGLSRTISENSSGMKDSAKAISEALGSALKEHIRTHFQEKAPELTQQIADALKNAPPAMLAAADTVISALAAAIGVSEEWESVKSSISDTFGDMDTVKLNLQLAFDGIPDDVKQNIDQLSQDLKTDADTLQTAFDNLKKAIFPEEYFSSGQAGEEAGTAFSDVILLVSAAISAAAEAITNMLTGIMNFAAWLAEGSNEAEILKTALAGIGTALGTLAGYVWIAKGIPSLIKAFSGMKLAIAGITAVLSPTVLLAAALAGAVAALMTAMQTEEWQIGAKEIAENAQKIKDAYQSLIDAYAKAFEKDDENLQKWSEFWQGYGEYLADGVENAKQKFQNLKNNIADFFRKVKTDFDEFINNFWTNRLSDWSSGMDDLISKFSGYGADLVINFIDGIDSQVNPLHEAGTALGEMLYDMFHHSTPEEGYLKDDDTWMPDMMQNFAQGIEKNIPLVSGQARELAETIGNILEFPDKLGQIVLDDFRNPEPLSFSADVVFNSPDVPDFSDFSEIKTSRIETETREFSELEMISPEMPEIQNPELVLDVPEMPEFQNPEIAFSVPETGFDIPELETSEIAFDMPELPELNLISPEIPEFESLEIKLETPSIPELSLSSPELPELENPEITLISPEIPEISPAEIGLKLVKLPSEAFTSQEIPEIKNPEIMLNSPEIPESIQIQIDEKALQALQNAELSVIQNAAKTNPVTEMINNHYHTINQNTVQNLQTEKKPSELTLYANIEMNDQVFGTAVRKIIISENMQSGGAFV